MSIDRDFVLVVLAVALGALLARLAQRVFRQRKNRAAFIRYFELQRQTCEAPGPAFAVGDRVQAKNHHRIDDVGGYGTVVKIGHLHNQAGHIGYLVEFDSFPPGRPLFMAPSELVYARDEPPRQPPPRSA